MSNVKEVTQEIINLANTNEAVLDYWNKFSIMAEKQGYLEDSLEATQKQDGKILDKSRTITYDKTNEKYAFCFIYSYTLNMLTPVVMDKVDFDKLNGYRLYMTQGRHDTVYLPTIKIKLTDEQKKAGEAYFPEFNVRIKDKDVGLIKLHRAICNTGNDDLMVDHIAVSPSIVTREMLRPATAQQNKFNTLYYTKVYENYFIGAYTMTEQDKQVLIQKGYKLKNPVRKSATLTRYTVASPKFDNQKELYANLGNCEKKFLGAYRYNPIKACVTNKEVMLYFCKCFYKWSDEEYITAKKHLMMAERKKEAEELFKYYGV